MSSMQAWLMIALAVSVFAPKSFFLQTNVVIFLVFNKCRHCFGLITNVAIALVLKQISSLLWFCNKFSYFFGFQTNVVIALGIK